ncbi:uncharacterized protein IWQ51_004777 [Labrenzia sp. EL_142]|nr:uncharacterized protein [Labrenzia sp. EL_142]
MLDTRSLTPPEHAPRLKRCSYIHRVDAKKGAGQTFANLTTRQLIDVPSDKLQDFEFVLSNPNSLDSFSFPQWIIRSALQNYGFLIPEQKNEINDLEKRFWAEKRDSSKFSIGIILTKKCNLRCIYCNQEHRGSLFTKSDESKVEKLFQREAKNLKNFSVTWWGGEPLLRLDAIERMSDYFISVCEDHNINYSAFTSTNGVLITEDVAKKLQNLKFKQFQISIDGPASVHDLQRPLASGAGTSDAVIAGLSNISQVFEPNVETVSLRIHSTKIASAPHDEWLEFLDRIIPFKDHITLHFNAAYESFRFAKENTLSHQEMLDRLSGVIAEARARGFRFATENILNNHSLMHCGAVSDRSWFVLPGGRITRCNTTFDDPQNDCGRILDDGRLELYEAADRWVSFSPFKYDECTECDVLPVCMGGCNIVDFSDSSGARCQLKQSIRDAIAADPRAFGKKNMDCGSCDGCKS